MDRDRLGRRRRPGQTRGLRPRHPLLPRLWISRAVRVAMPQEDWARLEALVRELAPQAPTRARAYGLALARLLQAAEAVGMSSGPLAWMDWEQRKTLRLLRADARSRLG